MNPFARVPSIPRPQMPFVALAFVAAVVALAAGALPGTERPTFGQALSQVALGSEANDQGGLASYGRLPLSFVPNAGQTDAAVRFSTHGPQYSFYFTPKAAVLAFTKDVDAQEKAVALHLRFVGGNAARIEGVDRSTGTVSYFLGRDAAKWRTGLPTYDAVTYRELWPGIDMIFRGRGGELKYEFRLAPGADPAKIRLAYTGADSLAIGAEANLLIRTPLGVLRDARPLAYQRIGGRKVAVASRYALRGGKNGYGFVLGAYDRRQSLVIDPGLAYSTFIGGAGNDTPFAVALDDDGNAYIAGFTTSPNFPSTAGAFDVTANGGVDAFVTKLNDEGSALVYSTYLGGAGFDLAQDIAVDESWNAYVVGFTDGSDFPTTPGAFQAVDPGPGPTPDGDDGFVVKLSRSGDELVYSTYLGGPGEDTANGVSADEEGHAYVGSAGATSSFPTTPGAFMENDPGPGPAACPDPNAADPTLCVVLIGQDVIASKLNPSGSALVYGTYLGGSSRDVLNSMTIDEKGQFYAAGATDSTNFPTTPGAFQTADPQPVPVGPSTQPASGPDGFVAKLNESGTALEYSTYLGGTGGAPGGSGEGVQGIGVDRSGHAYVFGRTDSAFDFPTTPSAYDTSYNGGENDTFVTKLSTTGAALVYSTFLGGSGFEQGSFAVALDRNGRASVASATTSVDFPTTASAFQPAKAAGFDAFVTTLNPSGSALFYSSYLGGSGTDIAFGVAVDRHGNLYVTGRTNSALNFPTTPGAYDTTYNGGGRDAFLTKLRTE